MIHQPLISIVMNCYNGEKYLKQAITSIINQIYSNWELVFWDNLSEDRSSEIINNFNDIRIKYFQADKHTKLGEARNLAMRETTGKWIAFLDVDDLWEKNKLEKQIQYINDNNKSLGFIYGRCELIYENGISKGEILYESRSLPDGDVFNQLLFENFIPFVSAIVNKEKFENLGGFDDNLMHSTDYYMFLKLAEQYKVSVIQDVCCQYRLHQSNLTNELRVQGELESIEIVESFLPNPQAKNALVHHKAGLAIAYLREKEFLNFCKVLLIDGVLIRFTLRCLSSLRKKCSSLIT